MSEANILEVRDLEVTYRRSGEPPFKAVRGVSFDVARSGIVGVVGESGSGKSTLAKALMLLEPISGGEARFEGVDLRNMNRMSLRKYRSSVQMVFQDAVGSLNPRMKVREMLDEVRKVAGDASGRTSEELVDIVGLSREVMNQYPREMSGGQCQRVSFARALAVNPRMIIADEPVSALDVSVQARILNLVRDLRRDFGISFLLIAHDLAVVRNVCDYVCVMHNGIFEEAGPAEEVFSAPKSEYAKSLLAAVPDVWRALEKRSGSC